MTPTEHRTVQMCLPGYVGPVGGLLWSYLAACLGRTLTDDDKREILVTYLGHKFA